MQTVAMLTTDLEEMPENEPPDDPPEHDPQTFEGRRAIIASWAWWARREETP